MKKRIPVSSQNPLLQSPFAKLDVPYTQEKGSETLEKLETAPSEPLAKKYGRLILRTEKAHRAGKTVLVVSGFSPEISEEAIQSLAKEAKIVCSCGGTVTHRKIELQGNQPERVKKFFESKGFRVSGGS